MARYTHRVAIANSRLSAYGDGRVTFQYKDYAHGSRQRTMTLAASGFIRRFLLHVLPDGFMRIRSYGYFANRCRHQNKTLPALSRKKHAAARLARSVDCTWSRRCSAALAVSRRFQVAVLGRAARGIVPDAGAQSASLSKS